MGLPGKVRNLNLGHGTNDRNFGLKPFIPLGVDRVESALRLSTMAGWNQTAEDWKRLIRLDPECVGIWEDEGEIRASYSVFHYADTLAWIGMILVDPAYRGAGLGKAAFQAAIDRIRSRGCRSLGLDATSLGEPIYLKHGFQTIRPIVRWGGVLKQIGKAECGAETIRGWNDGIAAYDFHCTGVDRSALLRDLASDSVAVWSLQKDDRTTAYAMMRPGRTALHLGPLVASSHEQLNLLLREAARGSEGQPLIADVLCQAMGLELRGRGWAPLRELKRMTLPEDKTALCPPGVRLAAGFEWG